MMKEILMNTLIGVISGILIFVVLTLLGYLLFKYGIMPYMVEKIPNYIKEIFK